MPRATLLAGLALLIACAAQAADHRLPADDPVNSAATSLWHVTAPDPPTLFLQVGDEAPAFSYLGPDGGWHEFKDLSAHRSLLLIFGARQEDLRSLEEARSLFHDLGVTPVVVIDRRTGAAASLARRLELSCPIITDPICAIGDLFNSLDPLSRHHAPAFFVVDEARTIRALGHGVLPSPIQMLWVTARGLGRPLPESAWSVFSG